MNNQRMERTMKTRLLAILALSCLSTLNPQLSAAPLGTAFNYQGQLNDGVNPAQGLYDFRFAIYDSDSGGSPLVGPVTNSAVAFSNGLFTVLLDFGDVFDGSARWLEIGVRTNSTPTDFTVLSPRQQLTPTPYARYAPNADVAEVAKAVRDGAITESKIAVEAVKSTHLAPGAVTSAGIADGTITDADISASGISATKIIGGDLQAQRLNVGQGHTLSGTLATIAGGNNNTAAASATLAAIGGGQNNRVESTQSTIGGGQNNAIGSGGGFLTIAGGTDNSIGNAWSSVIAGGQGNNVLSAANYATIPGGLNNTVEGWYSFAAGRRAKALHHGSFVWGDSADADFGSTAENQFLIRASGGVGIGTQNPQAHLHVAGAAGLVAVRSETLWANAAAGVQIMAPGGRGELFFGGTSYPWWGGPLSLNLVNAADGPLTFGHSFGGSSFERMRITSSGNVGIGTAWPEAHLQVDQPSPGGYSLSAIFGPNWRGGSAYNTGDQRVAISAWNGNPGLILVRHNVNGYLIEVDSSGVLSFKHGSDGSGGERMQIQPGGNVGIGTSTPTAKLHVAGTIRANAIAGQTSQPLDLYANGLRALRLECATGSPNVIGGYAGNSVAAGVVGATIAGGGFAQGPPLPLAWPNVVNADYGSVLGGRGNSVSGFAGTVAGGERNEAAGSDSFAAGYDAHALHDGSFVWADNGYETFSSTGPNQFLIRAAGGVGINTASPQATLDVNGTMRATTVTITSDRGAKQDFAPVDAREILHRVASVPIQTWAFKSQPGTRHIGPVAQDFHAAFGVGADDKHIATVDADGAALAAIQGLYQIVKEKDTEISELKRRLAALEAALFPAREAGAIQPPNRMSDN